MLVATLAAAGLASGSPVASGASDDLKHVRSYVLMGFYRLDDSERSSVFRTEVWAHRKARCWRKREVRILREQDGRDESVVDGRTNRRGQIDLSAVGETIRPGRYYAQTPKMLTKRFRCAGARSPSVGVRGVAVDPGAERTRRR